MRASGVFLCSLLPHRLLLPFSRFVFPPAWPPAHLPEVNTIVILDMWDRETSTAVTPRPSALSSSLSSLFSLSRSPVLKKIFRPSREESDP